MNKILLYFMSTWIYRFISLKIIPEIYFWFAPHRDLSHFKELEALVLPGDFLVTTTWNKLTHLLIPGPVDHAAIYVGNGMVVEMIGSGWKLLPLRELWRESTSEAILRPKQWDEAYAYEMASRALALRGTEYDIEFKLGVDFLYCSELLWICDYENRSEFSLEDISGLGRKYLSPTGVYTAKGLEIIYDTH